MTRKLTAAQRIRIAQRVNEREVLKRVRAATKAGTTYHLGFGITPSAWRNAADRLEDKGIIRWSRRRWTSGYVLAK